VRHWQNWLHKTQSEDQSKKTRKKERKKETNKHKEITSTNKNKEHQKDEQILLQASCSILHLPKDVFHQLLKIEDVTRQLSEEAKYYYDDCLIN
jgi:hypothetical protein